ncbi:MAG: D-cysteine desulfhydrase [Deltaproteobacteria bacterium]|jgi:D-cysteine desulfhydrase|nr:D-cysteine desulfhydrase [Deltaproteobacteria bacterium]
MNLHKFPRRGYVKTPTPIEYLPRLTRALDAGIEVYVKRDDLLPGTLGGNKTRKLDFSVAKALSQGADALVTSGAVQSNHCRLTLAWAIREGLECHLIIEERVPDSYDPHGSGNNFLFNLLGAAGLTVVPGNADIQAETQAAAEALRKKGKKPFIIPGGAADPVGALGYAACAQEIGDQMLWGQNDFSHVVCASGSGGTQAGLLAGFSALSTPIEVIGINVRRAKREDQREVIKSLTDRTLALLDLNYLIDDSRVICYENFLGPGYSLAAPATLEAVRLLARTEAILVDPVYTGKALAGLLGLAREGFFPRGAKVLFLHTGGAPALFSYLSSFPEVAGSGFKA